MASFCIHRKVSFLLVTTQSLSALLELLLLELVTMNHLSTTFNLVMVTFIPFMTTFPRLWLPHSLFIPIISLSCEFKNHISIKSLNSTKSKGSRRVKGLKMHLPSHKCKVKIYLLFISLSLFSHWL